MAKTIIVAGYGSGISAAVAERFAAEGFSLALVGRSSEKLTEAVAALEAKGLKAAAFPADVASPAAVKALVAKVRETLPPITALHWNAYSSAAGDLLAADATALHAAFDVAITGLLTAVQEALPDLKAERGAVLVTNGGLGMNDPSVDDAAVKWGAMGLALANAAKHKLVGLLSQQLKADGVFVGEVMVKGTVKGSAWDNGTATIEASQVAQKFWSLYSARKQTFDEI